MMTTAEARQYPLTDAHKKMIADLPRTQAKANRDFIEFERRLQERRSRSWIRRLFDL